MIGLVSVGRRVGLGVIGRWYRMIVHQPVLCTDSMQLSAGWLDCADIYIVYGINTVHTNNNTFH